MADFSNIIDNLGLMDIGRILYPQYQKNLKHKSKSKKINTSKRLMDQRRHYNKIKMLNNNIKQIICKMKPK